MEKMEEESLSTLCQLIQAQLTLLGQGETGEQDGLLVRGIAVTSRETDRNSTQEYTGLKELTRTKDSQSRTNLVKRTFIVSRTQE